MRHYELERNQTQLLHQRVVNSGLVSVARSLAHSPGVVRTQLKPVGACLL